MVESAANVSEDEEKEQRDGSATAAPEEQAVSEEDSSRGDCAVKMRDYKPCGRPIHPAAADGETPFCLMHSHDPQKSDAAFQKEFGAILKAAGEGVADFTKFVFPGANYRMRKFKAKCVFHGAAFTQEAAFVRATFKKGADFSSATFTQEAKFLFATFTPEADFRWATFTQAAHFGGAKFMRIANFRRAKFTQTASFNGAKFTRAANFSGATFSQHARFIRARFTRATNFSNATFAQYVDFGEATFARYADFSDATFTQEASFNSATFSWRINFQGAKLLSRVEFRETRFRQDKKPFPGPIFSLAEFSHPEAIVFYKTYLSQALFHNCDVSQVSFSSVEWRQRKGSGKRMVFEEEVDLEAAKDLRPAKDSADERDYGLIAELYQQLKKNYDERKDYWTAGDFHYGELEMKRLASRRKNEILRWLVQHLRLVAWYKYASHYGESYVRPAVWLGVTLFLFALLFPAVGLRYDSTKDRAGTAVPSTPVILTYANPLFPGQPAADRHKAQWRLFGNSCLTALEIAAFQKEPAYQPVYPWGRLLTLIETLLTSTLAALFFLAVRRQFRR